MFDETLKKIADQLITHCRNGTEEEGLAALYSSDVVSIEAAAMPGSAGREVQGLDALRAKHDWWNTNTEVHSTGAEGPFLHGTDKFAIIFTADMTMKPTGERHQMKEVALYTVADGKIVSEEFLYSAG